MPKKKLCWSSWNYRVEENNLPSTIYWMNSLQNVSQKKNYFVSINGESIIAPEKIIQKIIYEHPIFSVDSSNAAETLSSLNETGPIYFSGSYFRYGFHEDAFTSGLHAAEKILRKKIWS